MKLRHLGKYYCYFIHRKRAYLARAAVGNYLLRGTNLPALCRNQGPDVCQLHPTGPDDHFFAHGIRGRLSNARFEWTAAGSQPAQSGRHKLWRAAARKPGPELAPCIHREFFCCSSHPGHALSGHHRESCLIIERRQDDRFDDRDTRSYLISY